MVTLNGRIAPPEGGFVTDTQTLAYPVVSVVVNVVELNPTTITKERSLLHKERDMKARTFIVHDIYHGCVMYKSNGSFTSH